MKKIMPLLMVACATCFLHSCKKTQEEQRLDGIKVILLPMNKTIDPATLPTSDVGQSQELSNEAARCITNPNNEPLNAVMTIEPVASPVPTYNNRGELVKMTYTFSCNMNSNQKIFMPGVLEFLAGEFSTPSYDPIKFTIGWAARVPSGRYAACDSTGGNLTARALRGWTVCQSGVSRLTVSDPNSDIVFRPGMQGKFLLKMSISELPGLIDKTVVDESYDVELIKVPVKRQENDLSPLWTMVLPPNNTFIPRPFEQFSSEY